MTISRKMFQQIYRIYSYSFPKDERRSREGLQSSLKKKNKAKALVIFKNKKKVVGFAIYYKLDGFCFVEHMAVAREMRGEGIGSLILTRLIKNNKHLVLEIEPPTKSKKAAARIEFYKRFGFKPISKSYLQPAYSKTKKPVKLWLMGNFKSRKDIVREIYGRVYRK